MEAMEEGLFDNNNKLVDCVNNNIRDTYDRGKTPIYIYISIER